MASVADEGARRGWRARGARHATRPADWRTNLFSARNGRVTSNLPNWVFRRTNTVHYKTH
eukprot:scaffold54124_cov60-Phaeocystis_antarctica.AAC.1